MNPDTLVQIAQKSLRVTIGATASLIETLQDPQRRQANFSKFKTELDQMTDEWEVKGESTEREARSFVDSLLSQTTSRTNMSNQPSPVSTTATPIAPEVQQDLQELTTQITALRAELERLREQEP